MADRVAIIDRGRVAQLGPPEELYRRPRSRFVAEFLGETNFIPGHLRQQAGPDAIVDTGVGMLRSRSTPPAAGQEFLCSIRPEALRIGEARAENTLLGTVRETTYLGELAQHLIEIGPGVTVRVADLNPRAARAPSERVALIVDPEDVVLVQA